MVTNNYILLIANTYLENGEKIGYGSDTVEIRKELFEQQLKRFQKVEKRDNFITKKEFLNHCSIALHLLKEFVALETDNQFNYLNGYLKDIEDGKYENEYFSIDNYPVNWEAEKQRVNSEIQNFDFNDYLVPMGKLTTGIYKPMCNNDIEFIEACFNNLIYKESSKIKKTTSNLESFKPEKSVMSNLEIANGIFQADIRKGIRTHIQLKHEIAFESFLEANYLADETYYIDLIYKQNEVIIAEYEKIVNFHDISEGEEITEEIKEQWYEEKVTRDHYWYYKEYQSFLNERLLELEKIKTIEKSKITNSNIIEELDAFEIFNNQFKNEIIDLFNKNISKNETLNIYYKDYLPKYLEKINEIISHTEQMENDFKVNFPKLKTELNSLNAITSKFKKTIFNALESTLESTIKNDFERHLSEYLNITNKLETDLRIEGKNISNFFSLFYNRMLHIKQNPQPQQLELLNSKQREHGIIENYREKFDLFDKETIELLKNNSNGKNNLILRERMRTRAIMVYNHNLSFYYKKSPFGNELFYIDSWIDELKKSLESTKVMIYYGAKEVRSDNDYTRFEIKVNGEQKIVGRVEDYYITHSRDDDDESLMLRKGYFQELAYVQYLEERRLELKKNQQSEITQQNETTQQKNEINKLVETFDKVTFESLKSDYPIELKKYLLEFIDNREEFFIEFELLKINKLVENTKEAIENPAFYSLPKHSQEAIKIGVDEIKRRLSSFNLYIDFLNNRLIEIQKQSNPLDLSNVLTVENSQKPKPKGKTLQEFFKDGTKPEIITKIQEKYKDYNGQKMAYLIYLLHKEFCIINYSTNSTTESRKHFVNALTCKDSTKIMAGINVLFDTNEVTLKDANRSNNNDPHYLKHNDYITIQNEIQTILNPIK